MRAINLHGADNARDFGGLINREGKMLRSRQFVRSNALNRLTREDQTFLMNYGLRQVIDLRTGFEINESPNVKIPGVEYHHVPLMDERAIGITHDEESDAAVDKDTVLSMPRMYEHIVTNETSVRNLAYVFDLITSADEGVTLWHCQAGKDRCGIVSALFLTILNVHPDTIMEDYLLTNVSANTWAKGIYDKILTSTNDAELANRYKATYLADEIYLKAANEAIIKKWGSPDEFIKHQLNITSEKAAILRRRMILD